LQNAILTVNQWRAVVKKFLCINPIRGNACSFAEFSSHYRFESNTITNDYKNLLKEHQYVFVCFDYLNLLKNFGDKFNNVCDIKTIYQLKGLKFDNLIDLSRCVLGQDRIQKYVEVSDKVLAHINSYKIAKIDYRKFGEEALLPPSLLAALYSERATVIMDLYRKFYDNKSCGYDCKIEEYYSKHFVGSIKSLHEISLEPINIDLESIKDDNSHQAKSIRRNTIENKLKLEFNPVGAKTGRLAFKRKTANIYGLPRETRSCIAASEDCKIVQLDFKSFHWA